MSKNHAKKRGFATRMADLFRTRRSGRTAPTRGRRLSLEPLETRTLLAIVSMSVDENPGTIVEREGGECTLTFTITPEEGDDIKAAGSVRVLYSISGLQPHEYEDGGCVGGSVAILTGQDETTAQVTIKFLNDAIAEGDDTCTIKLESAEAANPFPGGGNEGGGCCCCGGGGCCGTHVGVVADQEATVTILDDDHWAIQVEVESPNEIVERDGVSGYTISRVPAATGRSGDTSYEIAVAFTMGGGAAVGADYSLGYEGGGSIPRSSEGYWHTMLPEGGNGVGVRLQSINDAVPESDKDAILSIVEATSVGYFCEDGGGCNGYFVQGGGSFGQAPGLPTTVTIEDDDHWAIQVERTSAETIVERGPGEAQFTVTRVDDGTGRSGDLSYGILVDLAMSGLAEQYIDYNLSDDGGYLAIYGDKIVIEDGDTTANFKLTPENDHKREPDEDAVISVENGTSFGLTGGVYGADPSQGSDSVTILDDDWWKVGITVPEDDQLVREPGEGQPEQPDQTTTLTVSRTPSRTVSYEMDTSYSMKVYLDLGLLAVNAAWPGLDYELSQGLLPLSYWSDPSVTIPGGATERLLTFRAKGDGLPEIEEVAPITVLPDASPDGTPYTVDNGATQINVSLQDNDWTVSIAAGDADASEDSDETTGEPLNPGQFQITRSGSGPADHDLLVKFTIPYSQAFADAHPQDHWAYALVVDEAVHGTGSGAAVSLAYDVDTNTYRGTATIPNGAHTLAVKLVPNDDEYLELDEDVRPTVVPDDSGCYGAEPGICYVVETTSASATVTIEDNDVPELYAVTYEWANYITTDPVYDPTFNNGQFANYLVGTRITEDHWFDVSVANEAGENADGYPHDRSYPASYVRNTRPSLTAEWMRRPEPGYTMFLRGDGPDSVDAPWEEYTINGTNSSRALFTLWSLPNTIKYFENFAIDWEYQIALSGESHPSSGWEQAGSSSTELYVTLGTPQVDPFYHTVKPSTTTILDGWLMLRVFRNCPDSKEPEHVAQSRP